MPSCWSECFAKYEVDSRDCLCSDTTGQDVSQCITSVCDSGDAGQYAAWVGSYCDPAAQPSTSGAAAYLAASDSAYETWPVVVTNTETITKTMCPGEEPAKTTAAGCPTCTSGEVYTTYVTTHSESLCPEEKTFVWGTFTSSYTGYKTSTITHSYTTTVTHGADPTITGGPGGYGGHLEHPGGIYPPGYGGWSASLAPYPHSYPLGNSSYAHGTGISSGLATKTKACSTPTPTTCTPCQGQPGNDQYCGYTIDDNWYEVMPTTCNTVTYDFDITQTTVSPDGVERLAFLVNGQFPGPLIKASWGDTIVVKVTNNLPQDGRNGTTMHFHGIRQNGTNEYDGVASLTQCPVAPGQSMTYTFRADSYGSSWWHAHLALQTYEGIFGPMQIEGPAMAEYDDEEWMILQDWTHETADEMYFEAALVGNPEAGPQTMDLGLINGKGGTNYFQMSVQQGKRYRLRLVNTAMQSTFKFHIDGHSFSVIAMDFVPIEPYTTNILSINVGQRYDLILEANQKPGNYWINSDNQQACGNMISPNARAILNYAGAAIANPTTTPLTYTQDCNDEPYASLVPHVKQNVGSASTTLDEFNSINVNNGNPNLFKWTLSGTTFVSKWADPTLLSIHATGEIPDYSGDLAIEVPNLGEWVYVIIDATLPVPHPIHLHGHDFMILAQGIGEYSGSIPLNLINPPRRDVAVMPVDPTQNLGGYLVIAYQANNPGVWLLHCHIGWVSFVITFSAEDVDADHFFLSDDSTMLWVSLCRLLRIWRESRSRTVVSCKIRAPRGARMRIGLMFLRWTFGTRGFEWLGCWREKGASDERVGHAVCTTACSKGRSYTLFGYYRAGTLCRQLSTQSCGDLFSYLACLFE